MTQMGFYGQRVRQFLHLEHEPPSLITRSLRNAEIAVTETLDDAPVRRASGEMGLQDAYVVSLKLNDYPSCEVWERGNAIKADIRAGATYFYDMKKDPRFVIDKPFHSLHFYLPRSALDGITEQYGAPRVGELPSQLGVGHDDRIIGHIGAALLQALRRPAETNRTLHRLHDAGIYRTHRTDLWRNAEPLRNGPRRSCPVADEARMRKTKV